MSKENQRITFLSTARCIGILLVVFGHSYPFDVYIPPVLWKVNEFIYSFHMPLFIFISGYLVAKAQSADWLGLSFHWSAQSSSRSWTRRFLWAG